MLASGWLVLWGSLLILALGGYAILTLAIAVGGIGDIRAMLRSLREKGGE